MMSLTEDTEKISWNCWLRTVLALKGAFGVYILGGMHQSMASVILPQLEKEDSLIRVTRDEETWIASLGILMTPVSVTITGPFIDAYGRKKGLLVCFFIMGLGYAITASAREVYQICIGQAVSAFGLGFDITAVIYLAETSTKKQRSIFFSQLSAVRSGGAIIPLVLSKYLPWKAVSTICSIFGFLLFIAQCFGPESPAWLFKSGQRDASSATYRKLGRSKPHIARELDYLQQSKETSVQKIELRTILEPTVWKPLLIMFTFHILLTATGEHQIARYVVDFAERLRTTYDPLSASVLLSASRFLSNLTIAIYVKSTFRRKVALTISSSLMASTFFMAGVYEYSHRDVEAAERAFQWLPLACIVVYTIADTLGMASFPWNMSSELFPLNVRGTMSGVISVVGEILVFLSVKMYYVCLDALQIYGILFTYGGAALAAVFFAIFVLPETHNRELHEIEQSFRPKHTKLDTFDREG